ncbi:zinc ribbon domain-containing protein [Parashewanella spongiae]|uniref:Zinc ribbon domain-containing protein n=1 Tax=Parashewanella spongiae TaxID=342950 RepID=A0A3A6UBI8_9GAMM|nr:zinc ribbon domain-containing protein [Parashewanella spongiae]MCL1079127.1 zinc ribbon domain-containing protein [Parashewanella spongiae]RJY19386.1 zinc ribbon domain-containing protein [Parashewanella spongiae]
MALIECSACKKRISSLAKSCQFCGVSQGEESEGTQKIRQINRASQLQTHSFIALTLFIAGVMIWFWGGEAAEGTRLYIGGACFVFGFIGYLITRIRIILNRRGKV